MIINDKVIKCDGYMCNEMHTIPDSSKLTSMEFLKAKYWYYEETRNGLFIYCPSCSIDMSMAEEKKKGYKFINYNHHGAKVWGREDLKGTNRTVCLCFCCDSFKPGDKKNCPIAQTLYGICRLANLVTPVYECPKFKKKDENIK